VSGAWRPKLSGMRPRTPPHCAFAKWGPRIGDYAPWPSNIGMVALSTVIVCALLMFVNVSSIGCGCRVAFIAHLAKFGPQTDELTPAPRRFPLLTCSPSRVVCIQCLETRAKRDAAADCPTLCIREIGPSSVRASSDRPASGYAHSSSSIGPPTRA